MGLRGESMILLWLIIDQLKTEKQAKEEGWIPAMSMKERLGVYFFYILLPIIIGTLTGMIER